MSARLAILLAAVSVGLAGCGGGGRARIYVTSGCVVPVHDPPAIVVSCDGSSVISKIHWQRWDSPLASGTGTQSLDTCIPDCATGAHRLIDVRLQASDPKRCPSGLLQYRRVVVYPSGSAVGESLGGVAECPPQ